MAVYRGLIRGFLAGALLTIMVCGGVGYFVYKRIRSQLSPDFIQQTAQSVLSDLAGRQTQVASADLGIAEGSLTLLGVRIASETDTYFTVERITAFADGGLAALKEGRFAQLRFDKPVLHLERRNGHWNLSDFLAPILARLDTKRKTDSQHSNSKGKGNLPLNRIQLNHLELTVSLEDGKTYSAVKFDQLDLTRENTTSPWNLSARKGSLRLNPSAEEWPLFDAAELVRSLVAESGIGAPVAGAQIPESTQESASTWALNRVIIDEAQVDLIHSGQSLSLSGLSFDSQDFFQFLKLQTGSLEKKNLKPNA